METYRLGIIRAPKYTAKEVYIVNIDSHIRKWAEKVNEDYSGISKWSQISNEEDVPVISSIGEFLEICRSSGIEVEKKKVYKQGKTVTARIAKKDETIRSREGMEYAKRGSLIVDDGDNTFYAVPPESIRKYYEVDSNGNSITGDDFRWKKIGKTLWYYITPFDVDIRVTWQREPLHATAGYSLVCNDEEGKDISPVAPEIFGDETLWKTE